MKAKQFLPFVTISVLIVTLLGAFPVGAAPQDAPSRAPKSQFSDNVAFDVSPTLRDLAAHRITPQLPEEDQGEIREEHGPEANESDTYFQDTAVQTSIPSAIPSTATNFEGISNQDN